MIFGDFPTHVSSDILGSYDYSSEYLRQTWPKPPPWEASPSKPRLLANLRSAGELKSGRAPGLFLARGPRARPSDDQQQAPYVNIKALGPRLMGRDAVRVSSIHWARGHPVTLFLGTICNPHVTQKRMNN